MDLSQFINKHKFKIAFGLFVSYLCFSLYKIGEQGLWGDECFSIDLGSHTIREIIDYSLYKDTNPPLYLIFVHYWCGLFGDSEFALRSLSSIATSGSLAVLFLFALRFFNWQTAIFAIMFFFSSNELYYYSEEGRTYGLVLLFCALSNYAFMSLIEKPNWVSAVLLGLFNISIFYLHTLASFSIVGQAILVPILAYGNSQKKESNTKSFLGYELKFIAWYILSWLVFLVLFLPWSERFFGVLKDDAKGFWLQKPTFIEYKQVLYDFCNADYLFYAYTALTLLFLAVIAFSKKYRESAFRYKLLLVPVILGPFLFHLNFFAASITPIFLKRYILFTLLGFILAFAYILSSIKIGFKIKMMIAGALCIISFFNIHYPRPVQWDYKNGVAMLMQKKTPTTIIFTDINMLFAYYSDREGAFKAYGDERSTLLAKENIFMRGSNDWTKEVDLSAYTDIYYTQSFAGYYDPERLIEKGLRQRYTWVEDLNYPGMNITHYKNFVINPTILDSLRQRVINDKDWYNQVLIKAKERNISVDSMVTADAVWAYTNTILKQK
jgi:hypothetical protein